jgi:hypothetical protein
MVAACTSLLGAPKNATAQFSDRGYIIFATIQRNCRQAGVNECSQAEPERPFFLCEFYNFNLQ